MFAHDNYISEYWIHNEDIINIYNLLFLFPQSKEPLKGSELLDIANNLGGDKIEALAVVFDMLDRYHDIVRDSTIHNNRLFFLQEWRLRMESRSELSQALFDIGLPRLSEM